MKYILISCFFLSLMNCEFEDQWKKSVFTGKVMDRNQTINMDVKIDLRNKTFTIIDLNKSFPMTLKIEHDKNVYYLVDEAKDFPLPRYFQIKKEKLTQYRLNMFFSSVNTNMVFADLFIEF